MIRAKAKTTRKGPAYEKLLKRAAQAVDGSYAEVGVTQDAGHYPDGTSVVLVAAANEFGVDASGSDGRRIRIPERSFLRAILPMHKAAIEAWRTKLLANMVEDRKQWSAERALTSLGLFVQTLVQNRIRSDIPPPNAPSTLRRKEKMHMGRATLIEQGVELLVRSITFRVVAKTTPSAQSEHT